MWSSIVTNHQDLFLTVIISIVNLAKFLIKKIGLHLLQYTLFCVTFASLHQNSRNAFVRCFYTTAVWRMVKMTSFSLLTTVISLYILSPILKVVKTLLWSFFFCYLSKLEHKQLFNLLPQTGNVKKVKSILLQSSFTW